MKLPAIWWFCIPAERFGRAGVVALGPLFRSLGRDMIAVHPSPAG